MRYAMPSVANVIFLALLGALVFTPLSVRLLGDAGIGWHIRTGQQILATHAVPRVDSFSSTMGGRPWIAWEWLYDLFVGQLEITLGLNGVVWFTTVVIAAIFSWMFRILIVRGVNVLIAVLLTLLAASASMIHFLARPHVVSWLFTLAWFVILDSAESDYERVRGSVWLLPLMMLVWVNVHGGFLIGFVLLGIFWISAVWQGFSLNESRIEESFQKITAGNRAWNLVWVGLLSAAATLVNPYGWKLHAHIFSYLSDRFLMDHIDEFQSPNFHGVAQRCFLILLIIAIVTLAVRGRHLRISYVLTVLFAVWTGLYASRSIPVSSILLVVIVGPLIWPNERDGILSGITTPGFIRRMTEMELGLRGQLWPVIAVVVTFLIAAAGGRIGSNRLMDAHFDRKRMPVEAVNYLQSSGVAGPVLSPDFWGGYLIYRLYPREQVVVDDRHDLYGAEFFKLYLKMIRVENGWQEFLRQHEASCLLLPKDSALTNVVIESREWRAVYGDDVAVIFVRDSADMRNR
jgi:hypothetical protein